MIPTGGTLVLSEAEWMQLDRRVASYMTESARVLNGLVELSRQISTAALWIAKSLQADGTVYWMGNGGSAADAQHLAAELVGRFERERKPFRSIAITTDSSILTALGNDYGFDHVFERQVEALARQNDVLVGISTSGRSRNVLCALEAGRAKGAKTILLTGGSNNISETAAELLIKVPSERTCHIQEGHIAIGQAICGIVEEFHS